jgi:hypothetical protein
MANTFDIRFAKSAGLLALFEAPVNRFRWKGAGRLSIDAQGVSIAVRRGLVNLFSRQRSHRIAPGELTDVYREGEALRLEFGPADQRQVLPIWAAGHGAAEQIVKLLPTSRTVELEHATGKTRTFRFDWRVVAWLAALVIALAAAAVSLRQFAGSAPLAIAAPPATAEPALPAAVEPAAERRSAESSIEQILAREGLIPIPPGTPAHEVARRQQLIFESEVAVLRAQYLQLQTNPTVAALEAMQPRWWAVALRIETSEEMSGPAFMGFREAQLAVISSWRSALALQAAGLRMRDDRFTELGQKQGELAALQELLLRRYAP